MDAPEVAVRRVFDDELGREDVLGERAFDGPKLADALRVPEVAGESRDRSQA
jgi:hypothetical protein